jgi:AMP-activated protein kinase-like protein
MAGTRDVDPRLHAYLDGELPAPEAAHFDGDLRPGSIPRNQLETFKHLGSWLRATRPRAPANLAQSVVRVLEYDRVQRPRKPFWRDSAYLRWIWVPTAALAGLAFFLLIPGRHASGPLDQGSLPESAAPSHTAPAIQTSRTVASGVQLPNTVRYVFTVKADQVREICLAGDFNQWKVCDAPLMRVGEGVWSITIDLPRGRHEYMFVIDGKWVTDPNATGYSRDGFGNRNALLVV